MTILPGPQRGILMKVEIAGEEAKAHIHIHGFVAELQGPGAIPARFWQP